MDSMDLIKLFESYNKKDSEEFQRIAWNLIAEEKRKKHHLLAEQLQNALRNQSSLNNVVNIATKDLPPVPRDNEKGSNY